MQRAFRLCASGASQPSEHQPRCRKLDERFAGLHFALIVFGQPSVANQPGEAALNDPAAWLHAEATAACLTRHDLQLPPTTLK